MSTFSVDMRKFAEKAGQNAETVIKKICLDMMSDIILKTPVDTGRARANWQASLDAPASGTVNFEADKGSGAMAPNESNASRRAIAAGMSATENAAGRVFWLSNNLPYIERLEYGHSKQAPRGMVRTTINEVKRNLRKYGVK